MHARSVSIRARVRAGDVSGTLIVPPLSEFQSAPACERATAGRSCCRREYNCFNPRPRASGRLCSNAKMRCRCTVSIRARVRAGDPAVAAADASIIVSIRARVRAGDYRPIRCTAGAGRFNPRPRASGRLVLFAVLSIQNRFNPRPRASGRRRDFQAAPCAPQRFNPRPRASGRPSMPGFSIACMSFQSAPACERATPAVPDARLPLDGFNPRPRASGRPVEGLRSAENMFQSAPACERATPRPGIAFRSTISFNPRPRASGRLRLANTALGH